MYTWRHGWYAKRWMQWKWESGSCVGVGTLAAQSQTAHRQDKSAREEGESNKQNDFAHPPCHGCD